MPDPALDIRDESVPPEQAAEWQALLETAEKFQQRWNWEVACVSAPNRQSLRARLINVLNMYPADPVEEGN